MHVVDGPSDVEQTYVTDQEDFRNLLGEIIETNKIVPQVEEKESVEYQQEPNYNIFEFEEKNNEGEKPETTKKDDVIPRKKRVLDRYPQEAPKRRRKHVTTDEQALA